MQASKFRRVRVPPIESPVTRRKVGWRLLIVILAVAGVLAAGCGGGATVAAASTSRTASISGSMGHKVQSLTLVLVRRRSDSGAPQEAELRWPR
jgi:hypothetical protein